MHYGLAIGSKLTNGPINFKLSSAITQWVSSSNAKGKVRGLVTSKIAFLNSIALVT